MSELIGYRNGAWIPMSEMRPDPADRGTGLADQVTEVERTFDGKSFRMREHIDRLYKTLRYVRIDPGLSPAEMIELTEEGIERNRRIRPGMEDVYVIHVVARGGAARAWAAGPPNVYVKYASQQFAWFASLYETGVHGVVTRARSYEPAALDPKAKHLSRLNMSLAELEANDLDPGAWAIMTDGAGNVTEGTSHNVFVVTDGVIRTPTDQAVLGGISRGMVLDLAARLGMPAREEDLQPYDLYTADECFFSGTSFSVLPVTEVDRRPIGDGKPGPVVQRLLAAWSEAVGIDIVAQAVNAAAKGD